MAHGVHAFQVDAAAGTQGRTEFRRSPAPAAAAVVAVLVGLCVAVGFAAALANASARASLASSVYGMVPPALPHAGSVIPDELLRGFLGVRSPSGGDASGGAHKLGRRILIAYASLRQGHEAAARAIQEQVQLDMPDAEVILFNTIETETIQFRNGMQEMVRPSVDLRHLSEEFQRGVLGEYASWANTIDDEIELEGLDWTSMGLPMEVIDELADAGYGNTATGCILLSMQNFEGFVLRHRWDLVISTSFLPATVIGVLRSRSRLEIPSVTVVTDFYPRRLWLSNTDHFFVATTEVRDTMYDKYYIHPARVTVSGVPISPRIRTLTREQAHATIAQNGVLARAPPLGAGRFVLALPVSDVTGRNVYAWRQLLAFAERNRDVTVVAVAGRRSGKLLVEFSEATNRAFPRNFNLLGSTEHLPELMALSDIIVSKPSILTVSEALALSLPFLLVDPFHEGDQATAQFLLSTGAAVEVADPEEIPEVLAAVFSKREQGGNVSSADTFIRIDSLRLRAKTLGQPAAAQTISMYVQDTFRTTDVQEFAPGMCCCGKTLHTFAPYADVQKACMYFHAPVGGDAREFQQTGASFTWRMPQTAVCPASYGGVVYYRRLSVPAASCNASVFTQLPFP